MAENAAAMGHEERVERLYASMQKAVSELEASGLFSADEITMAAALVVHDRRQRHADPTFRMPTAHEIKAVFDELDADAKIEPLLSWTAKNFNRLSKFVTADPWTHETLKNLMESRLLAVRDRNPLILRAVIQFALAEYLLCGYDPKSLHALFEKLHLPARPDE
ncbi:MAG: hypothetical protein NPIRA05_00850 [Nitrospirales bacterium]|nr:MAG: hypothetical protein NPIRA05_00850 [Nitrospirales bacterium]